MEGGYLESVIKQFEYYKLLGEKTFDQVSEEKLFLQYNEESNSIATIVKHLSGNMLSRWTDFLTTDGEKEWRNRDSEFANDIQTKEAMLLAWKKGWEVFMSTLKSLKEDDLGKIIYIRNQGHTVMEAINRQLAHYPYHIGQIVFLGKMWAGEWKSLSIPRGNSAGYNKEKFAQPKQRKHFTDEYTGKVDSLEYVKEDLRKAHEELWNNCLKLSPEDQLKSFNGKWSAAQHVQHINKGSGAFYKYLQMPKDAIAQNFGMADHASRSTQGILDFYKSRLDEGIKSTPRFDPEETITIAIQDEIQKGKHIVDGIITALNYWSEEDLEKYVCPHPNLGNMTAREMLLFTVIHARHHAKGVISK